MTSSTTARTATGRGAADDARASDRQDAGWSQDADSVTTVISESGLDDENPAELTTVVSDSGLTDENPAELTTVVSRSGMDDDEDDSESPAVAWREDDSPAENDEEQGRRIRIAGFSMRPWQLVMAILAACLIVVVAVILGSTGHDEDDNRAPTPQPSEVEAPADAHDASAPDATPLSGDGHPSADAPAAPPPVDPAHDPALSDPTSTDPDLNTPPPPAAPAPLAPPAGTALPQGPLAPNQLPGGPPLPYGPDGGSSYSAAPYNNNLEPRGYAAQPPAPAPTARGYQQPRNYDRDRYQPRRDDRGGISHRLGVVTGLSRDSDRDYRRDDRDRDRDGYGSAEGYPDSPYGDQDSYGRGDSYGDSYGRRDGDERGPYSRRYNHRYDRDSDRSLTGALGGL